MVAPPRNNEAQKSITAVQHLFVAPWARGLGVGQPADERRGTGGARRRRFRVINLDVRETQTQAIAMYETLGYRRWGVHPKYAHVRGRMGAGHLLLQGRAASGKTARLMIVLPGHRPQGRLLRAPRPGRYGPGDGVQRRSCRPGRTVRGGGVFAWLHLVDLNGAVEGECRSMPRPSRPCSAHGRSAGPARRRHPRHGDGRDVAGQGRAPGRARHGGAERPGARPHRLPPVPRTGLSWASMRATAWSLPGAGRRPRKPPHSISRSASRTPASRPSCSPISPATARSAASTWTRRWTLPGR